MHVVLRVVHHDVLGEGILERLESADRLSRHIAGRHLPESSAIERKSGWGRDYVAAYLISVLLLLR